VGREPASRTLAQLLWLRGTVAQKQGGLVLAVDLFRGALAIRETRGEPVEAGHCLHGIAECEKLLAQLDDAERDYREACRRFRQVGDHLWLGRSLTGLADVRRRTGDLHEAIALTQEALERLRRVGNRHSMAIALNGLGDIEREAGALSDAERHYREGLRLMDELGSHEATIVRLNLGLVLLARGELEEARRVTELERRTLVETGREGYMVYVHALLLPCFASDPDGWDEHMRELRRQLSATALHDNDIAFCLQLAGQKARDAGMLDRARDALTLALRQWDALGRPEAAAETSDALRSLA